MKHFTEDEMTRMSIEKYGYLKDRHAYAKGLKDMQSLLSSPNDKEPVEGWISVETELPQVSTTDHWNIENRISDDVMTYSEFGMRWGRYYHNVGFWTIDGVTSSKGINIEYWQKITPPHNKE